MLLSAVTQISSFRAYSSYHVPTFHPSLDPPLNIIQLTPSLFPKRKLILSLWKSTGIQARLCSLSISGSENTNNYWNQVAGINMVGRGIQQQQCTEVKKINFN